MASTRPELSHLWELEGVIHGTHGEGVAVDSPIDGSRLGTLSQHHVDDIQELELKAREAQKSWASVHVRERARIAARFGNLVLDNRDQILDVIQAETGKSRVHALEEVVDVALTANYYARTAEKALRPQNRAGAIPVLTKTVEMHHPKGLVGIIAPFNYPFTLAMSDAISALLAGNSVLLKPDSQTPYSALIGIKLLREAGLPQEAMQVAIGEGESVGAELVERSDFVMFTGSTETGRNIAKRCGERLISFSAELGGKNPLIVLADADIERAAAGAARASFSNAGQLCISAERIYINQDIYDEFIQQFVAATQAMSLGVGTDWDLDVGSLISEKHAQRVQAHVDDAVGKGATVLTGGTRRPDLGPYVFEPTVLADVPASADLARNETFGPVVSVYPVRDEAEAISRANDSEFGLNASIWTSHRNGLRLGQQLQVGTVNINEGYAAAWGSHSAPMGGWKLSGLGRRHGQDGILKYTESQTLSAQRFRPIGPWPGMSNAQYEGFIATSARILNAVRGLRF